MWVCFRRWVGKYCRRGGNPKELRRNTIVSPSQKNKKARILFYREEPSSNPMFQVKKKPGGNGEKKVPPKPLLEPGLGRKRD